MWDGLQAVGFDFFLLETVLNVNAERCYRKNSKADRLKRLRKK